MLAEKHALKRSSSSSRLAIHAVTQEEPREEPAEVVAKPAPEVDGKRDIFDALYTFFSESVTPNPKWTVAEFGIGKGGFGRYYLEKFKRVYGIDIRDFSHWHRGVEFVISDGNTIPLPDASVDLVTSHSVLEHVRDLNQSIGEIDRITKPGGHVLLTVNPLYYSAYGAHLHDTAGKRLENWEHLDPASPYFLTASPITAELNAGHDLNQLSSEKFLAAVGRVPWTILSYRLTFERKPLPAHVDRSKYSALDLMLRGFRFIARKEPMPSL